MICAKLYSKDPCGHYTWLVRYYPACEWGALIHCCNHFTSSFICAFWYVIYIHVWKFDGLVTFGTDDRPNVGWLVGCLAGWMDQRPRPGTAAVPHVSCIREWIRNVNYRTQYHSTLHLDYISIYEVIFKWLFDCIVYLKGAVKYWCAFFWKIAVLFIMDL